MAKRSEQKQEELQKYLALSLAAIDYSSAREIGSFVCDGYDVMIEAYESQRNQVRKYFDQRRLDRLIKGFDRHAAAARWQSDFDMVQYLKKTTGYDIDLLFTLRSDTKAILKRGTIQTKEEEQTASQFLSIYEAEDSESSATLKTLVHNYHLEQMKKPAPSNEKSFTKSYEEDGMIVQEVHLVTGGGSHSAGDFKSAKSPDKKKRISISNYRSPGFSCTTVHLSFPKGSGAVFQANVVSPEIKAEWKDDQTITIYTRAEYETPIRVNVVESRGERVQIEYIEVDK